jgi:hypothetical protein
MYPVRYEADYDEQPDRVRTIFRLILAIPWFIIAYIYVLAASVVAFLAWFALLFTGRYPQGLYNFNAGVLRFLGRANAFFNLQTDQWPPFGFEEAPDYPIRVPVDPPQESYNRWKVFFRLIVGIPAMFMLSLIPYVSGIASFVNWLHITFTGRSSAGTHNALTYGLAYQVRATAYFLLMTETLPPVSDQAPAGVLGAGEAPARTRAARARERT